MDIQQWREAGKSFRYGSHQIFYREAGRGAALVLLHGFPTASWDWHKVWQPLASRYHLIAPDFIGFGFSDKPAGYPYSIHDQAGLVEELLACLGIRQFHLFTHDYGDTVAQELLARAAEGRLAARLQSVCLLNGGLFPEAHQPRLIQKLMISPIGFMLSPFLSRRTLARNFRAIFGKDTQPAEQELDEFWSLIAHNRGKRVMHLLIRYMAERRRNRDRWLSALQAEGIPIRLIDGAADPISGRHLAAHFKMVVPDADVVLLEGIGHYPQTEAPEQVLAHFLAFMEGQNGKNA